MHQKRKGKQWYFGMKPHVGTDPRGVVHHVTATDSKTADFTQLRDLLHGQKDNLRGDEAYWKEDVRAQWQLTGGRYRVNRRRTTTHPITYASIKSGQAQIPPNAPVANALVALCPPFRARTVAVTAPIAALTRTTAKCLGGPPRSGRVASWHDTLTGMVTVRIAASVWAARYVLGSDAELIAVVVDVDDGKSPIERVVKVNPKAREVAIAVYDVVHETLCRTITLENVLRKGRAPEKRREDGCSEKQSRATFERLAPRSKHNVPHLGSEKISAPRSRIRCCEILNDATRGSLLSGQHVNWARPGGRCS